MSSPHFPSNAHTDKSRNTQPEQKPVTGKVIEGSARVREKGLGRKVIETFAVSDAREVRDYVFLDVVIPAVKTLLLSAISEGSQHWLWGSTVRRPTQPYRTTGPIVNYGTTKIGNGAPSRQAMSTRGRQTHDFNELLIDSRSDAEMALDTMRELIDLYGQVSVREMYESVGVTSDYTDDKWGWKSLDTAAVRRVANGYILDLPRPITLD